LSGDIREDNWMGMLGRAFANLLLFLIALALLLFLPAWSLTYVEGWVFIGLLGALSGAITLYLAVYDPQLLERRLKAGPGAEQERSQKIIQIITSAMLCAMAVVAGFDHRWRWSEIPLIVVIIADIAFVLAFALIFVVFRENTYTSGVIEIAEGQRVISSGPYAIVRHPMYTGGIIFMLAAPLMLGSWWALIPAVVVCGGIVVRLLDEERFLARNLPGYADYRQRVRWRLLPGVW
jgi:protein-S-isoprenylcysteine O-methyltransferase Ste14